jgi:hypothetical protein
MNSAEKQHQLDKNRPPDPKPPETESKPPHQETAEEVAERERAERQRAYHAYRIKVTPAYLNAILVIERDSNLDIDSFFKAAIRILRRDAMLLAALQEGELDCNPGNPIAAQRPINT